MDAKHNKCLRGICFLCVCVLSIKVIENLFSHSKNLKDYAVAWDSWQYFFRRQQAKVFPKLVADFGPPVLRQCLRIFQHEAVDSHETWTEGESHFYLPPPGTRLLVKSTNTSQLFLITSKEYYSR